MPKAATKRSPFAENLATARKAKGLSQRELAKLVNVSPRVIALYETVIKNPTPEVVVRLAKTLDVSIDELMGHKPVKVKEELNRKIARNVRLLEELDPAAQKMVVRMIKSLHPHRK
jgi:transcriptional regulator with XRE-family HTH domain